MRLTLWQSRLASVPRVDAAPDLMCGERAIPPPVERNRLRFASVKKPSALVALVPIRALPHFARSKLAFAFCHPSLSARLGKPKPAPRQAPGRVLNDASDAPQYIERKLEQSSVVADLGPPAFLVDWGQLPPAPAWRVHDAREIERIGPGVPGSVPAKVRPNESKVRARWVNKQSSYFHGLGIARVA